MPCKLQEQYFLQMELKSGILYFFFVIAIVADHSTEYYQYRHRLNLVNVCKECVNQTDGFIKLVRSGSGRSMVQTALTRICLMNEFAESMGCEGYVNVYLDTVIYIINNKPNLTAEYFCGVFLQNRGCVNPDDNAWSIDIPEKKFDNYRSENEVDLGTTLKILHLTDIHYDPEYKVGSNSRCDLPLCCQESSGKPSSPEFAAGYWGDYNHCDMPWHAVLELLNHITTTHKDIDFVYYTGDIMPHTSWKTTKEGNEEVIRNLFRKFNETFKVPVYTVLGNHESHPTDDYAPNNVNDGMSTNWLFDLMDKESRSWLPPDTSATIQKGGYYSVLIRPGLRIIGLNSNVCYTNNLWLYFNEIDPFDQLKWLVSELQKAEQNGEYVHILAHVPPGDLQCHKTWLHQYNRIVRRFSKTIKAQFNGHTHNDELRLFYDAGDPKKVVNVAFNGGSFTTFVGLNPNYRVYDVNSKSFEVLDYHNWIYNLEEANLKPGIPPRWYEEYSLLAAYALGNASLDNLGRLVEKMQDGGEAAVKYCTFFFKNSTRYVPLSCNSTDVDTLVCSIKSPEFEDAYKCNQHVIKF